MKKCLLYVSFLLTFSSLLAQNANDPVVMTIAGKDVTKSEYVNVFLKNNGKQLGNEGKTPSEYAEMFVNFKLKVKDAESLGMDTMQAFKSELEGYRKQLAQPYLSDNEVNDKLLREAYDRMKFDVRASHILIKIGGSGSPKDTTAAYNKIMEVRSKIIKGEKFDKMAKEYSTDPSAKENGGDLGYFTALQMVYPFENAVYNAKVNEVTMPVRTRFGYHIIMLQDKRPAMGQITVAHLMVSSPRGAAAQDSINAQNKINEIYQKLKGGSSFEELVKQFSDDKGSINEGGKLPSFGTGRMVAEFEKAAFALKNNGDFSEPVLTQYGWHIIKRLEKKDLAEFDKMKTELKSKIGKDSRAQRSKEMMVSKLKKEYHLKEEAKALKQMLGCLDTTLFEGKWTIDKAKGKEALLFALSYENKSNPAQPFVKKYTQKDFVSFIESRQSRRSKVEFETALNEMYNAFVTEKLLSFHEELLEIRYPEFKLLLQEYRDGILLFDLTDKKVWSRAMKDTSGIKEFYNKNKSNYMWQERAEAKIYTCNDEKTALELRNLLKTTSKKPLRDDEILSAINKDSQLKLKIENGKFQKGDNAKIDKAKWVVGLSENLVHEKQVIICDIKKIMAPESKTLSEAKGLVTADYQKTLDKDWIETLKKTYVVSINDEVLKTIK